MDKINIFKDYYKFPLKMWDFMEIKVFTDDNQMAFDWMINAPRELKEMFVNIINGCETTNYKVLKEFKHENGVIYCKLALGKNEGREFPFCRIRGWGHLVGVGGYNLDPDEAAVIQDAFAEYCVNKLNGK
jgi:hypothetical protein